jgi:hypothetical protein
MELCEADVLGGTSDRSGRQIDVFVIAEAVDRRDFTAEQLGISFEGLATLAVECELGR